MKSLLHLTISGFKCTILLVYLTCLAEVGYSQELNDNFQIHTLNPSGNAVDFTIPQNPGSNYISFVLRGGGGGNAEVNGCGRRGGGGATVKATIGIGDGPGEVAVGDSIRFLVGKNGADGGCGTNNCNAWGGGGGGSAVLAKRNDTWEIIAVAGGGGGCYIGNFLGACIDRQSGQGGRATESGGDGEGNAAGNGGSNGNGGRGGGIFLERELSGGGGGAFQRGRPTNSSRSGHLGFPGGGFGGFDDDDTQDGGWGFGGGGAGDGGGGGGGGYSGGGGGGQLDNGAGGGSYVHPLFTFATEKTAGPNGRPDGYNGFITYQFICIPDIVGFEYVQQLCEPDGLGRIQLTHDLDAEDPCGNTLNWRLSPINGWGHLGNGLFRSMRTGTYTAQITNTVNGEVLKTYTFTVGVNPVAPVARCRDLSVNLTNGQYENNDLANLINNGSTSACDDPLIVEASQLAFNCDDIGDNMVVLTVTGNNGVSATCTSTVTVTPEETAVPIANCRPDFTVDLSGAANDQISLSVADIDKNSFLPPCLGGVFIDRPYIDCGDAESSIVVTLTVFDVTNRSDQCTTTIDVQDSGQPTASCKEEFSLVLTGEGTATLDPFELDNGSLSNNCSTLSYAADITNFDCDDIGNTTVTVTIMDGYGRNGSCQTEVEVMEIAAPEAYCQDITIALDAGGTATLTGAQIDAGSNAGCTISLSTSIVAFDCDDLGDQVVTLMATSAFGQQATCQATVTVIDEIPPVANCPDYTFTNIPVNLSVFRTVIAQAATDNCGVGSIEILDDPLLDCEDIGVTLIRVEIGDASGNLDTCVMTVAVDYELEEVVAGCDGETYSVELQDDGAYLLNEDDLFAILRFSDGVECRDFPDLNPTASQALFTCSSLGEAVPVTFSLTEPGQAPSTCEAFILVEDNIDPICVTAPQISVKAFLSGPFDPATGLMRDDLRALGLVPIVDPYGNFSVVATNAVLEVTGPDAIVDWVQLELRSATDPTQIEHVKSVLLQRDGDVVDWDGVSPVTLPGVAAGNYYVAIKHRNHLAMMTQIPLLIE